MKILVPIKRVPDYQIKVKVKSDGSDIEREGVKWIVNPFDEIAVEEALKLKESGIVTEVIVMTVGPKDAEQQLRYCMAMGADSGIHVITDANIDSEVAASAIAAIYKKSDYKLIILGKQSIDSDANQTAQLLSVKLEIPQACFASKVVIEGNNATVTREIDGGLEHLSLTLPCVISTDLRLNQPRYASLPGIMKAKKKPIEEVGIDSLGIDVLPKVKVIAMSLPKKRSAGRKVADVAELVSVLQNEAKVL